jgi:tetratricopeptide (TPR) repeat protein
MRYPGYVILICGLLIFSGCAGVGVTYSSDPLTKLNDAEHLYSRQDRPMIAERLIREAIDIYQQRNDALGLAHSHRTYATLLRSSSVVSWEKQYRETGFLDKTVTYENRLGKSSEYMLKALEYYKQAEKQFIEARQFDGLTNVYFNMGMSYWIIDDKKNSCRSFDQSVEANTENIRRNPNAKPNLPPGYTSFREMIQPIKKNVGCE